MTFSTKILLFLGAFLTLGLLSFIVYKEVESSKRQQAIEESIVKQKDLIDGITRSMSEYTTKKDLEQFIKDSNVNLQAIKDDLNKLHAEITAVNTITVNSGGYSGTNLPSTPTTPDPSQQNTTYSCNINNKPDPFGYLKNTQNLQLNEDFHPTNIPFGVVGFSAWQQNPWSLNIFPRTYNVISVIGTDENQRQYVYNKFTVNVNNKEYDVKITSATTKQEYPQSKFSLFNPRIFAGADIGYNLQQNRTEFTPNINIGLMSVGKYIKQPDFSFVQVGLGYEATNKKAKVILTPFAYNIGGHVPLIDNVYIGPSVHVGFAGDISVMAGIRVGL